MKGDQPHNLPVERAQRIIRTLAADSSNIVMIHHARQRSGQRRISPRQIQMCCLKGTIAEGPFLNAHGNWQVTLFRHAAGERVNCVVAIDWPSRLIIVTVF